MARVVGVRPGRDRGGGQGEGRFGLVVECPLVIREVAGSSPAEDMVLSVKVEG